MWLRKAERLGHAAIGGLLLSRLILGAGPVVSVSMGDIPGGHKTLLALERARLIRITATGTGSKSYSIAVLGLAASEV